MCSPQASINLSLQDINQVVLYYSTHQQIIIIIIILILSSFSLVLSFRIISITQICIRSTPFSVYILRRISKRCKSSVLFVMLFFQSSLYLRNDKIINNDVVVDEGDDDYLFPYCSLPVRQSIKQKVGETVLSVFYLCYQNVTYVVFFSSMSRSSLA